MKTELLKTKLPSHLELEFKALERSHKQLVMIITALARKNGGEFVISHEDMWLYKEANSPKSWVDEKGFHFQI